MINLYNKTSSGAAASLVVSNPVTLYDISIYNSKASSQYIQIFDAASLPADGATPTLPPMLFAAKETRGISWINGRKFSNGIVICNSSTDTTKTIGSDDCFFDMQVSAQTY